MQAIVTGEYGVPWRMLRAVTGKGFGMGASLKQMDIPKVGEDDVQVKVKAIALNPSDNLHADLVGRPGSILGCDFCGEVVKTGSSTTRKWRRGERVAGVVHGGMKKTEGSYAEFLVTPSELLWEPPASLSDQQAATFGVSFATAVLALYKELKLPFPDDDQAATAGKTIFVYAGSASASLFVIQLAKLACLKVVTTCGTHNFDLVKSYGADFVYDSRSAESLERIQQAHPGIEMAFDGLSNKASTTFCATLLQPSRGKLVVLLDTVKAAKNLGVEATFIMMYSVIGEHFAWLPPVGLSFPEDPAARRLLVRFYQMLPSLTDKIKPLPTKELDAGLNNIPKNMLEIKKGSSGAKLTMSF